jgi:protein-L-isoaspartate(D-aspartate) O-methyltransferase
MAKRVIVSCRSPLFVISGLVLIGLSACLPLDYIQAADPFQARRAEMIELIKQDVDDTSRYLKRSSLDRRVLAAMAEVPRHEFVPADRAGQAYQNRPLPIGHGQTISQPYIVAIMTDLLDLEPQHKVLEIGTGSGYQAAVLAALDTRVWSIEIIEPLGQAATTRLQRLGYDNVEVAVGDGYYGWPEHAPFDAIIVTAAANHIPPPLVKQLAVGGKMIIPVGSRFSTQELILITRASQDELVTRQVLPVRFVPLTGGH